MDTEVQDPYSCPQNTISADYHEDKGTWLCVLREKERKSTEVEFEVKHDIFEPSKNDQDPCPPGYWWHRTHDPCSPITCTTEQNGQDYDLDRLCPEGHHVHLGGDRTKPLVCVEDYRPENEKTGGKNPNRGGCDRCIINKPGHTPETKGRRWKLHWRFFRKKKRQEPLSAFAKSESHFGGRRLKPSSRRIPVCPRGTATALREDGRRFCFGGRGQCPPGSQNIPTSDPFEPYSCIPCPEGEESVRIDGFSLCLINPCPSGRLPVPEEGIVERYSCKRPLEKKGELDWNTVLDPKRKTPSAAVQCPEGQGLYWSKRRFQCRPCSRGKEIAWGVIWRNGHPLCGLKEAPPCPDGQVPVREADKVRCASCPEGSVFSVSHGIQNPRCVPQEGAPPQEQPPAQPKAVPLLR